MSINQSAKHHLLILSQHYEIYRQLIEAMSVPDLSIVASGEPEQALNLGGNCDMIFGEPSLVSKVINRLPNVIWVQATWAGVEPLLALDKKQGYTLTNVRNVYGPMMSEYVFGYLLLIERRILTRWKDQLREKWDDSPNGTLRGKTLGLLGVGSIGAHLASTAHHFRMRVYGFTRQSEDCVDVDKYFHSDRLLDFATGLDYVVCTLPGTPSTKDIVDENFLAALPHKAWLVNIGRGSTIHEPALVKALMDGALGGAILDVFQEEPLPHGHPLWTTPNTFITSHTAARNYPPDIAAIFIKNYNLFIRGEPLLYRVDFTQGY